MAEGVLHIDDAEMRAIIGRLSVVMLEVGQQANSAISEQGLFSESLGEASSVIAEFAPLVAECAATMRDLVDDIVTYLQSVLDGFDRTDHMLMRLADMLRPQGEGE